MEYAKRILNKELHLLEEIVRMWPESAKTEYAEAYKDRKQKIKQLKDALLKLSDEG